MSLFNGDKSRDNRRRRKRIKQREKNRALRNGFVPEAGKQTKAKPSQVENQKS